MIAKNKRKGETRGTPDEVPARQALLQMLEDSDHCVRMCMARMVPALYLDTRARASGRPLMLLPRKEQEDVFSEIHETLKKADTVEVIKFILPVYMYM